MDNKDMPAFPLKLKDGEKFDGMGNLDGFSKREKIAAMAMQGILANHWCQNDFRTDIHALGHEHVAKQSVGYADALLNELEK